MKGTIKPTRILNRAYLDTAHCEIKHPAGEECLHLNDGIWFTPVCHTAADVFPFPFVALKAHYRDGKLELICAYCNRVGATLEVK